MKTQAALCAKAIKQELKQKFPHIKFSVTSSTYSMGNSVRIKYKNAVPASEIEKVTDKYQYGHFDGMIDYYELSNVREDIPQAKFVFVERTITDDILLKAKERIVKEYDIKNPDDEKEWYKLFREWSGQKVWRELRDKTIL